jgi:preprotein translocase subunit SecE
MSTQNPLPPDAHKRPEDPQGSPAELVRSGTPIDGLLWLVALSLLIGATLANQYLPAYWAPASQVGVRAGVIAGMIVVAFGLLWLTHQGKGFVSLLRNSQTELRRITWPAKEETFTTTWIVLLVSVVMAVILWALDQLFGWLISAIIG